ncbi:MAG: ABC transporter permease [Deltaproteobacteria bacterium]|nr:ABC transporter permease [Deltaproteobacteria bacterium]
MNLVAVASAEADIPRKSFLALAWRRFLRHRLATLGALIVVGLVLMAVLAPWLAPHDPNRVDIMNAREGPSREHILGCDVVGRDVLSRLIYGTRVSLSVGLVAVAIGVLIGTLLGCIAGYFGGWPDMLISRLIDAVLSFPPLMLILVIVGLLGPRLFNIMLVLGLLGWPQVARIVRGQILAIREEQYVLSSRAVGAGSKRIILTDVLPNIMSPIIVDATFGVARAILIEAGLSFLGMGVQPPTASWGNMLNDAQSLSILESMFWMWVPPGLMIFLATISINFVGDGLRDALDPKLN